MAKSESYRRHALNHKNQRATQGIKNSEVLDQDEIKYRWPQIYSEDIISAMFNDSGSSGSTLMARRGIQQVTDLFEKKGG